MSRYNCYFFIGKISCDVEVSTSVQIERLPLDGIKNYRPFCCQQLIMRHDLYEKRDALFAEVASFTLNSDHGDIDRDAQRIVDAKV